jgi:integrase/recombinase XerD
MPAPPTNRGRRFPPEPLTPEEVQLLLKNASGRSASGLRLRALVAVMALAGLRLQEALDLRPRDIDLEAGTLRVRRGKADSYRLVGLNPTVAQHLERWLTRRAKLGLTGRHPVFATYSERSRHELDPRYVRTALAKLGEKAGIEKRVHPHGLRHTFAFNMAQRNVPPHQLQQMLGHQSLQTTDIYVRHLNPTAVVDLMKELA